MAENTTFFKNRSEGGGGFEVAQAWFASQINVPILSGYCMQWHSEQVMSSLEMSSKGGCQMGQVGGQLTTCFTFLPMAMPF